MMAAGEIVPEFVSEKNDEERDRKRQSREKKRRVQVSKTKRLKESVERGGLIVGIGCGKMRAGDERGEKGEEK